MFQYSDGLSPVFHSLRYREGGGGVSFLLYFLLDIMNVMNVMTVPRSCPLGTCETSRLLPLYFTIQIFSCLRESSSMFLLLPAISFQKRTLFNSRLSFPFCLEISPANEIQFFDFCK